MAPGHAARRLKKPCLAPLLVSAACLCLLCNPLACHAAPRSMLQANASAAPAAAPSTDSVAPAAGPSSEGAAPAAGPPSADPDSSEGPDANDVSALLLGGTLVPDQLAHGVVVIILQIPATNGGFANSIGTGVLIKPAFVMTAGHVVGMESPPGSNTYVRTPLRTEAMTKICQSTSGTQWYNNGQNCVTAKTFTFYDGAADVAIIGLDAGALILPGSWGSSQTYPTPNKHSNGFLFELGNSYPAANQQVTLYGAGPGTLNVQNGGLVRSGIFNTVGTCDIFKCSYTTTQSCQQKNSAGGDSGGPVFDSNNVLVGIHNAGQCKNNPIGPTNSKYLPVTSVLNWIESTANTNGCANGNTNMIGATLIGDRVLPDIRDTLQIYQCYLGAPNQIYIAMNSSQSKHHKEAVLIKDSCNTQINICDISIEEGEQNVNQPQVCVPAQPSSPTGPPVDPRALGGSFSFDVYQDSILLSQHTGATSDLASVCNTQGVTTAPGAKEFQTSDYIGGGILINWIGVGCASCPGSPSTPTGPPNPQPGG